MKKFAIFFPQFHQVKVNDDAWGVGFTDWALVAAANAFSYWQRRAPVSGFYNLAKSEDVKARFKEAADAGLDGFGIYHYRFDDGPELDAVERYLRHTNPPLDFSFFFIWANESWSKRWAGKDTEILKFVSSAPQVMQVREHVAYLRPFMESESYTRLDQRPMFVIYRPEFFRDPKVTIALYREEFERVGLEPSIGFFLKGASDIEYSKVFDFCYLFEPRLFFNFNTGRKSPLLSLLFKRLTHLVSYSKLETLAVIAGKFLNTGSQSFSFDKFLVYFKSAERKSLIDSLACSVQNVLTVGWNNVPRYRGQYLAIQAPSTEQFSQLMSLASASTEVGLDVPLLCNAWNEWSEGAALEPCSYLGDSLLKIYVEPNSNRNF